MRIGVLAPRKPTLVVLAVEQVGEDDGIATNPGLRGGINLAISDGLECGGNGHGLDIELDAHFAPECLGDFPERVDEVCRCNGNGQTLTILLPDAVAPGHPASLVEKLLRFVWVIGVQRFDFRRVVRSRFPQWPVCRTGYPKHPLVDDQLAIEGEVQGLANSEVVRRRYGRVEEEQD